MNAREKFQVGQQVRMTQEALSLKLDGLHGRCTGDVRGFSKDGKYVRIYRHGDYHRTTHVYSIDYWEPDNATPATQAVGG